MENPCYFYPAHIFSMKNLILILFILIPGACGLAQNIEDYPEYPVPAKYRMKSAAQLPYRVDNSAKKYFPAVFNQYGYSCNQASSIGYVFNYEINRLRNLSSNEPANLFTPGFVWNFFNSGNWGVGVSYFDSWEVVKTAGCASYADYPFYQEGTGIWMSGYDKYLRTMGNRITVNYSLPVGTPEDLLIFKQYLFDHLEGSPDGGVASFQISSDRMDTRQWDDPDTGESWPVIWTFGNNVGHAMTFVGYNDSVRIDLNNDMRYTNDVDINKDGAVDMRDWEIGALLAVNSWGQGWNKGGKSYVLYSVVARNGNEGGIWGRSVHVVKALKEYNPQLTMRVVMRHEQKNKIRILAGVSTDTSAIRPKEMLSFPMFSFQGDELPLLDMENTEDSSRFEFGLDISPLLTNIDPGKPVKFFLVVEEKDLMNVAAGQIDEVSVIHYANETSEILSPSKNIPLINNGTTYVSVIRDLNFSRMEVEKPVATTFEAGEKFTLNLQAAGGIAPYRWELVNDYQEKSFTRLYEVIPGDTLSSSAHEKRYSRIDLPFSFPFFGTDYSAVYADINGALHFENVDIAYPYMIMEELAFRVRKSIVPLGADIQINDPEDVLICRKTDSVVTVQWHASVYVGLKLYPVSVSVNLYPDGTIEFLYGQRAIPPQGDYDWEAGISNGDAHFFRYASISGTRLIFENYGIRFSPVDYPDDLTLTDTGVLSGVARDTGHIWNIRVKATDSYNQSQYSYIPISTVNWEEARLLSQNFPNPFDRSTAIFFRVPSELPVILEIWDFSGRKVREIVNKTLLAGEYTYYWNAKDEKNRDVGPGLYVYRLRVGERSESGRMALIR